MKRKDFIRNTAYSLFGVSALGQGMGKSIKLIVERRDLYKIHFKDMGFKLTINKENTTGMLYKLDEEEY